MHMGALPPNPTVEYATLKMEQANEKLKRCKRKR
jgi:hypothetical protein